MEDKKKDSWNDKNFENFDDNLRKENFEKMEFWNEFWRTEKSLRIWNELEKLKRVLNFS